MSLFVTLHDWVLSGQTSHIELIILSDDSVVGLLPILFYLVLDSLCLNFPICKREIVILVHLGKALSVGPGTQHFASVGASLSSFLLVILHGNSYYLHSTNKEIKA